jgi:hypothetical protein
MHRCIITSASVPGFHIFFCQVELYTFEMLDAGIRKLLDEQKQNEEKSRRMLYAP